MCVWEGGRVTALAATAKRKRRGGEGDKKDKK